MFIPQLTRKRKIIILKQLPNKIAKEIRVIEENILMEMYFDENNENIKFISQPIDENTLREEGDFNIIQSNYRYSNITGEDNEKWEENEDWIIDKGSSQLLISNALSKSNIKGRNNVVINGPSTQEINLTFQSEMIKNCLK